MGRVSSRRALTGFAPAASLLALAFGVTPAGASVTIGQLASAPPMTACAPAARDRVQPTVSSGNTYVVPATGTITSWSHNFADADQSLTMKVFRPVAESTYVVVGHDGPHPLTDGALNTFTTSIPVKPGDVLGLNSSASGINACPFFFALGEQHRSRAGNLADGD